MSMPPTDVIRLTGVRATGHHGVLAHEKRDGQEFIVDVAMTVDARAAAAGDDLARTVNYAEVAADVVARIEGPSLDLIETLAGQICADVLARPIVRDVEVTVHKPSAPVGVPFGDVSVTLRRARDAGVVIALGANLGDAGATLSAALAGLRDLPGLEVTAVSSIVETDPVGGPEGQPPYLNAVALGRTNLAPIELLTAMHGIEATHGRTREVRWGARTLDLDLIQYGTPLAADATSEHGLPCPDAPVLCDEPLQLPHPRARERGFVLAPWADVDPHASLAAADGVHAVADLLAGVGTDGIRPGPQWQERR